MSARSLIGAKCLYIAPVSGAALATLVFYKYCAPLPRALRVQNVRKQQAESVRRLVLSSAYCFAVRVTWSDYTCNLQPLPSEALFYSSY